MTGTMQLLLDDIALPAVADQAAGRVQGDAGLAWPAGANATDLDPRPAAAQRLRPLDRGRLQFSGKAEAEAGQEQRLAQSAESAGPAAFRRRQGLHLTRIQMTKHSITGILPAASGNPSPHRRRHPRAVPACRHGAGTAQDPARNEAVLNFVGADIESVVKAIGHYTGTSFMIDPRVKGTITLVSEKPVTKAAGVRPADFGAAPAGLYGGRQRRLYQGGAGSRRQAAGRPIQTTPAAAGTAARCAATRSRRRCSASTTSRRSTWCRCCAR